MRKLRAKIKRTIKDIRNLCAMGAALGIIHLASSIPRYGFFGLGVLFFIGLCTWMIIKSNQKTKKYVNERGYVVLVAENDLEHRYIAKNILNRNLKENEIVHHINGKKIDNNITNLCVMDSEKHELFHSWLSWKKNKTGKYPDFKDQKRMLVQEYSGILLQHFISERKTEKQKPIEVNCIKIEETVIKNVSTADLYNAKLLFEELRKERLRIAREEKLPAYMIFYDKTLHAMSRRMPDTDLLMLKMTGPTNYQKFGPHFLAVIKKFKANHVASKKRATG